MRAALSALFVFGMVSVLPAADPLPRIPATEPKDVAAKFHAQHRFTMDLLAAEPLTTDPVAMVYDENGRAWVVEMSDYPYTDKKNDVAWQDSTKDLPLGKVRILEDTDGDGDFDKSTIFARDLSWPTGIALFKGGVYIAATPDIWYLKDTDGDLQADVREKVFTGFRKYNVQAVMNNLAWGLDHKIYGAGSSNGGTIQTVGNEGVKPVALSRNDYSIDPNTREFEAISGGARFGNSFDDWGNRFLCNIRNPIQHVLLPSRYLKRNPFLVAPAAVHDVAEAGDTLPVYRTSPPEPWRTLRAERYVAEGTVIPRSETNQAYFTSSSGVTVYRGSAYPSEFRNNVFVGEVAGNLIHRQALEKDGVTFRSHRTEQNAEFVTSDDNWFRAVNFVNAPDGTLHVLDMYRETIEHPWSIPDDIKAMIDLESGRDRGRIYRLSPPGFQAPKPPRLGQATTEELVSLLDHPNAWHRETAHRLLFEKQDRSAIEPLKKLVRSGTPLGRSHALWSLEGLKSLADDDLLAVLSDASAGVREQAIRLAESRFASSPAVLAKAARLVDDEEIRVRFQLAFSLGEVRDPVATGALMRLVERDSGDSWMRVAILSSLVDGADEVLVQLLKQTPLDPQAGPRILRRQLAVCVGARKRPDELASVFAALTSVSVPDSERPALLSVLAGLGEGLKRARVPLRTAAGQAGPDVETRIDALLKDSARIAADDSAAEEMRLEAIELVGLDGFAVAREVLSMLLAPRHSTNVQRAAVRTLTAFPDADVTPLMLEHWRGLSPALRTEVVDQLLARADRTVAVLEAIEAGTIPASQISPARRTLLLKHKDAAIAARAGRLLAAEPAGRRKEVVAEYQSVLNLAGDARRGQALFEKECITCHKNGDKGYDVGPNLSTIRHRTPAEVLMHILDPNREVGPNFVNYVVSIDDGRIATGIIESETATSVVLKRAEGVTETLLRANIEAMSNSGQSLMPEGLEKKLSQQDMADLLVFLLGKK
ncbi:Cytochrome c [Caulifigura coniformis]|uniref:Cytochrome c n=1 Tax=Caulifigura coniformis TaxID=2527983 RepID=A0A517SAW4_9PLAN|nr:PVC-type heme-binding CxxCH protein [Caulifigura coniformis]QDT53263.1 Cytochrome c [Caulifigura coniformis]